MASPEDVYAIVDRNDWPFIQNGAVSLFLKQDILDDAVQAVSDEGYFVEYVDCSDQAVMMADFSGALDWEKQFGYTPKNLNLDALNDAFHGATGPDRPKFLIVLKNFSKFLEEEPKAAKALVDIIECQSRDHLLFGWRLLAFMHVTDPKTHLDQVGGRLAQWNPKEWFMKDRGL